MSPEIQKIVDDVLDDRLPKNWRRDSAFIRNMSESFTQKKFSTYAHKYFPEYYAAYYLPNNMYKVQLMFLELFRLGRISFSEKKLQVLDIGAAVGTTAWALQDFYNILIHVLRLYGLKDQRLPVLEIDSIEKFQSNIDFFNEIRKRSSDVLSKVKVNQPMVGDVLSGFLDEVAINNYDIIIASNIISEFPAYAQQKTFADKITREQKKGSCFIIIETAVPKHTIDLKKLQFEIRGKNEIQVISPCGKMKSCSPRCLNCYSFRRESLKIPETMKLVSSNISEADKNEKLKWSYAILLKGKFDNSYSSNGYPTLREIALSGSHDNVSVEVEIVSGEMDDGSGRKDYYYLKVCDQSEDKEQFILKIPRYYELPRYHFGDVFEIKDARIERVTWKKQSTVAFAILIDPLKTMVTNKSELSEPRGLIEFRNVQEDNLRYFLKRFFGYEQFNEGQFEILSKVLQNENVLGVLATGGGKSLTFQLPALLKPGVSIIVSPLKSLMDDQVYGMKERFGFDFVDRIHSGMPLREKQHIFDRFRNGHLKILYVAPERLQQKTFQKELTRLISKGININYFPVDEAHCISEWGHDFRPSYARLKERQQALPHVDGNYPSIIALTATASQKVQEDILQQLILNNEEDLIHMIIDRKELSLEVIPLKLDNETKEYKIRYRDPNNKEAFLEQVFHPGTMRHEILKYVLDSVLPRRFEEFDIEKDAGLIFTAYADPAPAKDNEEFKSDNSRQSEGAQWLSEYLNGEKIKCAPWYSTPGYRGGLSPEEKKNRERSWEKVKIKTQKEYIQNKNNLLVTTKGFGMGIDKPNIRYVVHFGFPGALESYFQQIGRAGRDRNHSHCILLWDGPVDTCKESLAEKRIPQCFSIDANTNKAKFQECYYGRTRKCDYAKQIYFIETGYPTEKELRSAVDYLRAKSLEQNNLLGIFVRKDYIKDHVAQELCYDGTSRAQMNEALILETLYTLKYIKEFSQTYLKLRIKRGAKLCEIFDSTNSDIVKDHIRLLDKIYKGAYNRQPPKGFIEFDIAEYVHKIRDLENREILIDEVVEFFNVLNERDDIDLKFNSAQDFGYEIILNESQLHKNLEESDNFHMVTEWKTSQYIMLSNMVAYADLQPFHQAEISGVEGCRRAHIMAVFGTEGAQLNKSVRCNYCDNCGYNNFWGAQASDIVADSFQQHFIAQIRSYFSSQSKDAKFIHGHLQDLFDLIEKMVENDFIDVVETISNSWLEQVGEAENASTNLVIASASFKNGNIGRFNNRLELFFTSIKKDPEISQRVLIFLKEKLGADLFAVYNEHFKEKGKRGLFEAINIFSSSSSKEFMEIETEIGLSIIEKQCARYENIMKQYERMRV